MKHLKTIFSVLALVAVFSCTKSKTESSGYVAFELSNNQDVVDVMTRSQVSDYTALPSAGDFTLTIKDASSATVWSGLFSEWDSQTPLEAGNYTAEATYGGDEEGFDKPYFYGARTFAVQGGQTTNVSIPVSLGNTIVKVSCTENFTNYFKDYTFRLTRNGTDVVTFAKGETKAAFIDGYKITLEGTVTSGSKTKAIDPIEYIGLKEATAYTIILDVANVGGIAITVTFNDTVETIDLGDYELND